MKQFKGSIKHAVKDYWQRFMHSLKNNKISKGTVFFTKSITTAVKDNWRRKETKKKSHEK